MITLRLLGRPMVMFAGQEIRLPTLKAMGLVSYLALEGTSARSVLAHILWSECDEKTARHNLRQELYRIRTRMGGKVEIEADDETLKLAGAFETDVQQFYQKIKVKAYAQALELYSGVLLDGLELESDGFNSWLETNRERLSQQHLDILGKQSNLLEKGGDLRAAMELHLFALAENELLENHHREMMRLRFLLGDRSGALQQFQRCQEILSRELALEPLLETRQLAEQIRSNSLRPANPIGAVKAGHILQFPFMGRGPILSELGKKVGGMSLLLGEAGVGKSRVLEEVGIIAGATLSIKGREEFASTPLHCIAEALRNLSAAARKTVADVEEVWRIEAGRLVPELQGENRKTLPGVPPPAEGRSRFLEGLSRVILACVGQEGVILVDDLHWVDPLSVEVLGHLIGRFKGGSNRMIAASRSRELSQNVAAKTLVESLQRQGLVSQLELEPLTEGDVRAIIQAISGGQDAPLFSRRLYLATAGNPFFIIETLRSLIAAGVLHIASDGSWSTEYDLDTSDYSELPIPHSVRSVILERIDQLGPASRRLLEVASLAGEGFDLELTATATALTEWEGVEALEAAVVGKLVEPTNTAYRFSHDLIRRALSQGMSAERKKLVHRKLATALVNGGGLPGQIARHYELAGQGKLSARFWVRSAKEAARLYAYSQALAQYDQALLHLNAREAITVRLEKVALLKILDERTQWLQELKSLDELVGQLADTDVRAEVKLEYAEWFFRSGHYTQALEHADELLELTDLKPGQISWALFISANALWHSGQPLQAQIRLKSALTNDPKGIPTRLGRIHLFLSGCMLAQGQFEQASQHNAKAIAVYKKAGDQEGLIRALLASASIKEKLGKRKAALEDFRWANQQANALHHTFLQRETLMAIARTYLIEEDVQAAAVYIEQGLALAKEPQDPRVEGNFLNYLSQVQRIKGELTTAARTLERSITLADESGGLLNRIWFRTDLAELKLDLGDYQGVEQILNASRTLTQDNPMGLIGLRLETLWARLEYETGSVDKALVLEGRLKEQSGTSEEWVQLYCSLAIVYVGNHNVQRALELAKMQTSLLSNAVRQTLIRLAAAFIEEQASAIDEAFNLLEQARVSELDRLRLLRVLEGLCEFRGDSRERVARQKGDQVFLQLLDGLAETSRAAFAARHNRRGWQYLFCTQLGQPAVRG